MENSKIVRIQKSSRIAMIVTNVIKILCIVCSVAAIGSGFLLVGMRGILNNSLAREIEARELLEDDIIHSLMLRDLGNRLIDQGQFAEAIAVYLIIAGILLIYMAVVLHFVSRVFKNFMVSYSPFQSGIIRNLKIAFILITIYILQSSLGIGLLIALAAWCVINIFEYGCELQKQSDETL